MNRTLLPVLFAPLAPLTWATALQSPPTPHKQLEPTQHSQIAPPIHPSPPLPLPAIAPPAQAAPPAAPVIVELIGKRHTTVVTAHPNGPRFALWSNTGTQLSPAMSRSEFLLLAPEFNSAVATSVSRASFLWAGL